MGKGGRPTKYHDERCETILQTLRQGNTKRVAHLSAGVASSTFYEWVERYPEFADAVEKAEAEAESLHVVNIRTHSADNWQASAWWLERRRHDDWRKRETQEITGAGGGPLIVERVEYGKGE